ncbi:Crp/Fnr family transcriptional regulator [Marinomonas fungiae]|uniref:cAMP-binding domain of CRP or a regulatory subunit of cAMP-dependent protein kinases n=1 Tax=Marinomonas fungiae TaxID=1137284 RepID=A0A0K6II65_9GAMM|nr:Crp/Fnr family transcriptional regulator [Marinomonas fungiae]CUB02761.1 cAMP-binding domain of CRP or a regulatory subunit of cAMP-dependent protein kinases [Marinomonas fungiae]
MPVTVELLKRFPILQSLPDHELEQLALQSSLKNVSRRAVIVSGGTASDYLCFLFDGRLQGVDFTLDGREVGLYFVEPGDFCGELGLYDAQGQPESVIALAKSQIILIPAAAVRVAIQSSQKMVESLFVRMASRVRQLSAQRALLGLSSTVARVCGQLWMMLEEQDKANRKDGIIAYPPTHQELGIMLNLSRETVTRVFQTLQTQEIVKRDGTSRLLILNEMALRSLFEEGDG